MLRQPFGFNQLTGGMTAGVRALLLVTLFVYLMQLFIDRVTGGAFTGLFGLRHDALASRSLWQLFTYMFLHGGPLHLVFNLLVLLFIGPETERSMGRKQFYITYSISGVLGGLGWVIMSSQGVCVGASAAIFGLLGAFAALYPNRPVTLLVFFVLPVVLKAWVLVSLLALIEFLFLISFSGSGVAYGAHLAGGLAGYIYARTVFRGGSLTLINPWKKSFRNRKRESGLAGSQAVSKAEVDAILEKIAHQGMGGLTRRERAILDNASRELRTKS